MRGIMTLRAYRKPLVAVTNAFESLVVIAKCVERTMWPGADFRTILDAGATLIEFEQDD
jgi:hypothetical protein